MNTDYINATIVSDSESENEEVIVPTKKIRRVRVLQQPLQKPDLVKEFYRVRPTITYNTYQRNITNARTHF